MWYLLTLTGYGPVNTEKDRPCGLLHAVFLVLPVASLLHASRWRSGEREKQAAPSLRGSLKKDVGMEMAGPDVAPFPISDPTVLTSKSFNERLSSLDLKAYLLQPDPGGRHRGHRGSQPRTWPDAPAASASKLESQVKSQGSRFFSKGNHLTRQL